MPVQEFECQIARGQIGRYLNGEGLSAEGLRQLGLHVAECSECKSFLDQRKAALQGVLGEAVVAPRERARPVVEATPSEALIAQIRARTVADEPEEPANPTPTPAATKPIKPILTKPVIYCGLLGVVLLGMTFMNRNPSAVLGPHASQTIASVAPVPETAKAETPVNNATQAATAPAITPPKTVDAKATTPAAAGKATAPAHDAKPIADGPKTNPPAVPAKTDDVAKADVKIAPTDAPKSPISIDPTPPAKAEATGDAALKMQPARAKAKAKAPAAKAKVLKVAPARKVAKRRWHRRGVVRRWSLRHLRPGTAAIHVYRS